MLVTFFVNQYQCVYSILIGYCFWGTTKSKRCRYSLPPYAPLLYYRLERNNYYSLQKKIFPSSSHGRNGHFLPSLNLLHHCLLLQIPPHLSHFIRDSSTHIFQTLSPRSSRSSRIMESIISLSSMRLARCFLLLRPCS